MDRLDLLLFTVFAPVFCLTFLIFMDMYSAFTNRARMRAFNKYAASFAPAPIDRSSNLKIAEEILSGRRDA